MNGPLLTEDAQHEELPNATSAGAHIVQGAPTASVRQLDSSQIGEIGIWEMTPGSVRTEEEDEYFIVIEGVGVLTIEGREQPITLKRGVIVRLEAGDRTGWDIQETVRKVWFQAPLAHRSEPSAP